jgi:hypothetical protein
LDFDLEAGGFTIVVILRLNYGLWYRVPDTGVEESGSVILIDKSIEKTEMVGGCLRLLLEGGVLEIEVCVSWGLSKSRLGLRRERCECRCVSGSAAKSYGWLRRIERSVKVKALMFVDVPWSGAREVVVRGYWYVPGGCYFQGRPGEVVVVGRAETCSGDGTVIKEDKTCWQTIICWFCRWFLPECTSVDGSLVDF